MRNSACDIAIIGGGLAGGLAALALARRHPDLDIVLVERGDRFGGNHIWSFFDSDIDPADRWLVDPLVTARWPDYEVRFPGHRRRLATGYNSIDSERLDAALAEALPPTARMSGAAVASAAGGELVLADGRRITARLAIDARGARPAPGLECGWQKFVGQMLLTRQPHGLERPVVMDATVDQSEGYRFVYCLPFGPSEVFVEDTYYSDSPVLDSDALAARIAAYAAAQGWAVEAVTREEQGVLPVVKHGALAALWPADPGAPARIGAGAGLFQPLTSYSLPDAVRSAAALADRADPAGPAIPAMLRHRAERHWRGGGFYRMLATMLFDAADPADRYRVLERFYRLDAGLIRRFYAGRSTLYDKARILAGKPPVPVGRAIAALRGAAAGKKGSA